MQWPSADTVLRAQAGERDLLEHLVAQVHPHLRRFAGSLCSSREDAEDAVQEAMLALLRSIGTLRSPAALAAWTFRIINRECQRLLRRVLHSAAAQEPSPTADMDPTGQHLRAQQLIEAISALPPDLRSVFIMREVRGLSGAETASLLDISLPAMKTRLHRARSRVRTALET